MSEDVRLVLAKEFLVMDNVSYDDIFKLSQSAFDALVVDIRAEHDKRESYLADDKKGRYTCTCTADLLALNQKDFTRSISSMIYAYNNLQKLLNKKLNTMVNVIVREADQSIKQRIIH